MTERTIAILFALSLALTPGCQRGPDDGPISSAETHVGPSWASGSRDVYAIDLDSNASLASGNAAFALSLRGELELRVLEHQDRSVRIVARLIAPLFTLGGAADAEGKKVSAELSQPTVFVLEGGRLTDTWFAPGLSGVAVSTWRTLLSILQSAEPPGGQSEWEASEYDSAGRYLARYSRSADGSLRRRKTTYLALLSGQGGKPTPTELRPRIERSETQLTISAGRLQRAEQNETVVTRFDEHSSLNIVSHVLLQRRAESRGASAPFDERAFVASSSHLPPDAPAPSPRESSEAAFDKLKTEGQDFGQIVAFFEKEDPAQREKPPWAKEPQADDASGANTDPRAAAMLRERTGRFSVLTAFLRSEPSTVALALARVRAGSPAAATLLSALASAHTRATQRALVDVITDPKLPGQIRAHALVGAGRMPDPERDVATAIVSVLSERAIANQALLSLGSISRRLRDAGRDAEADTLRRDLTRALSDASTADQRALALRAISNSGDAGLFQVVKPFLNDSVTVTERAAAAEALRHMKLPEVNALLAERLVAESSAQSALAVMRAMQTRGAAPELVSAVVTTITSGSTPNVRQRAVELAQAWVKEYPALREVLVQAAEKDPDPQVRSAAAKAI